MSSVKALTTVVDIGRHYLGQHFEGDEDFETAHNGHLVHLTYLENATGVMVDSPTIVQGRDMPSIRYSMAINKRNGEISQSIRHYSRRDRTTPFSPPQRRWLEGHGYNTVDGGRTYEKQSQRF